MSDELPPASWRRAIQNLRSSWSGNASLLNCAKPTAPISPKRSRSHGLSPNSNPRSSQSQSQSPSPSLSPRSEAELVARELGRLSQGWMRLKA